MKKINIQSQVNGRSFSVGNVLIEECVGGDVIPNLSITKNLWDNELVCVLTKWDMYDYQAFIGLYEVLYHGESYFYLIDSNDVYKMYKMGLDYCKLIRIEDTKEYENLLEIYK